MQPMLVTLPAVDRHVLAAISICGISLDFLGGMYLAYDLLGGKHGPLRTLTRGVTYTVIFGLGYGLQLGWRFGLASGLAHGITLAIELSRASRGVPDYGKFGEALCSAIRGLGFGIGLYFPYGWRFSATFAVLSTAGQIVAYSRGMRPSMIYQATTRPHITRRQVFGVLNRTAGYVLTGVVCGFIAQSFSLRTALALGFSIGVTTAVGNVAMPYVEWIADTMPERRLGIFGVGLILLGFALQSVQYWVALLDLPLR
jgi:hypothetical protein